MSAYSTRNAILKKMGYSSYKLYLDSPLWKSIRARVLRKFDGKCKGCGRTANQVHHHQYSRQVLDGRSIEGMSAICGECHEGIEFHGEIKLSLRHANRRLKRQRKQRIDKAPPEAIPQRERDHREFQDRVKRIKATLKGRARDAALAEAYRARTASIR